MEDFFICKKCGGEISENDAMISKVRCHLCRSTEVKVKYEDAKAASGKSYFNAKG